MLRRTLTIFCFFILGNGLAQDSSSTGKINVFIDCNFCDQQFIKQNLSEVEFVRDRKVADVHLLFTRQNTGSGGNRNAIQFIGNNEYEGRKDTLVYNTDINMTNDDTRQLQLKYIQYGLIPYWIENGQIDNFDFIALSESDTLLSEPEDPWRNWVFSLGANGWFNGQETYRSSSINANLSARRVTDKNKFGLWMGSNNSLNKYIFEDTIIKNRQQSTWSSIENIFTITNHWSYGLFGEFGNSIYSNYKFYGELSNGIEYNFFDYKDAYSKQLILSYQVGARFNDYYDTTVFNQTEEVLGFHKVIFGGTSTQAWGNLSGTVTYRNYLHNFNLNSIHFNAGLNVRLFKGLSLRFNGSFGIIRNQINLKKQGVSLEELLLQQQQLATGFNYWFNCGISYSFGSIYNSIVNPRFNI